VGASAKPRVDADEYFYNDEAISEIKKQIKSAALVVADLTGCRPNVLYECGFADGIGVPVIHVSSDRLRKLPFDLRGRPTIRYVRGAIDTLAPKLGLRVAAAFADPAISRVKAL
jgi:nucleoside 2-deoxyribosyltransferase